MKGDGGVLPFSGQGKGGRLLKAGRYVCEVYGEFMKGERGKQRGKGNLLNGYRGIFFFFERGGLEFASISDFV